MKCPKCNHSISKKELFCPDCGTKIDVVLKHKTSGFSKQGIFATVSILLLLAIVFIPTKTVSYEAIITYESDEPQYDSSANYETTTLLSKVNTISAGTRGNTENFWVDKDSKLSGAIGSTSPVNYMITAQNNCKWGAPSTLDEMKQFYSNNLVRSKLAITNDIFEIDWTKESQLLCILYWIDTPKDTDQSVSMEITESWLSGEQKVQTGTEKVTKQRTETRQKKVNWLFGFEVG